MPNRNKYTTAIRNALLAMWRNWAIGLGVVTALITISPFLSKIWMPPLTFVMIFILLGVINYHNPQSSAQFVCKRLLYICFLVLIWSLAIMLFILMIHAEWFPWDLYGRHSYYHHKTIFITALIIPPVMTFITAISLMCGTNSAFCVSCKTTNGYDPDNGLLGNIYSKDTTYQLKLVFRLNLVLTIMTWAYYFLFYINTNFSPTDLYFYAFVPLAFYVLSLIFMGIRYYNMFLSLQEKYNGYRAHKVTMRFLLFKGDDLFLTSLEDLMIHHRLLDTPAVVNLDTANDISTPKADRYFTDISGVHSDEIKYLYQTHDISPDSSQKHYAVFLKNDSQLKDLKLEGCWYTQKEVGEMLRKQVIQPALAAELHRIYTMTMAWKTYDENGKRRYRIKAYRPTFRFRDFPEWDLDYTDLNWMQVANNNEDRPFFNLRRLWRRYTKGDVS